MTYYAKDTYGHLVRLGSPCVKCDVTDWDCICGPIPRPACVLCAYESEASAR